MLARLIRHVATAGHAVLRALRRCVLAAAKPAAPALVVSTLSDLIHSKPELVSENALHTR